LVDILILNMRTLSRLGLPIVVLFAVAGILLPAVTQAGQGFYTVDKAVRSGMLVSLTQNPGVIEPASNKNESSLVGVVGTAPTDLGVEPDQVSVQTDGVVNTLVSTVSGDIKVGDHISPSIIVGFGAKSTGAGWIVGSAQGSLTAETKGAVKSTVTDANGEKHDVFVATIPVLVKVAQENTQKQDDQNTILLPSKIQSIADSLAGRHASQVAVVLSFLTLLAGFVVAGIIVNAAVRNGIASIARQPLAKQAISKRMIQSFATALAILAGAMLSALVLIRVL
jgi:hypothetical protein